MMEKKIKSSQKKYEEYKKNSFNNTKFNETEEDGTSKEWRFLQRFKFDHMINQKTFDFVKIEYVEPNFEEMDNFDFIYHLKDVGYITHDMIGDLVHEYDRDKKDATQIECDGAKLTTKDQWGITILQKYHEQTINIINNTLKLFNLNMKMRIVNITVKELFEIQHEIENLLKDIDFHYVCSHIRSQFMDMIFARLFLVHDITFQLRCKIECAKKVEVSSPVEKTSSVSPSVSSEVSSSVTPDVTPSPEKTSENMKQTINFPILLGKGTSTKSIYGYIVNKTSEEVIEKNPEEMTKRISKPRIRLFDKKLEDFLINKDYAKLKIKSFTENWKYVNTSYTSPIVEKLNEYIEQFRRYPEILFAIAANISPEFQSKYGFVIFQDELPELLTWGYYEAESYSLDYLIGDKLINVIKLIPNDNILTDFMNDIMNKIKEHYPHILVGITDIKCLIEGFEDVCGFDEHIETYIVDKLRELNLPTWKGLPESQTKLREFLKNFKVEMEKVHFSIIDLN